MAGALSAAADLIRATYSRCVALGVFLFPAGEWTGDLDHLTPDALAALADALDAMDAAARTPLVEGDPKTSPMAALAAVIR